MRIDAVRIARAAVALAWAAGMLLLATVPSALAAGTQCSPDAVTARGEPSRFEWVAKTKARANWRRKVRALPGLGPTYGDWKKAADLDESCLTGSGGAVCTITARPCR